MFQNDKFASLKAGLVGLTTLFSTVGCTETTNKNAQKSIMPPSNEKLDSENIEISDKTNLQYLVNRIQSAGTEQISGEFQVNRIAGTNTVVSITFENFLLSAYIQDQNPSIAVAELYSLSENKEATKLKTFSRDDSAKLFNCIKLCEQELESN